MKAACFLAVLLHLNVFQETAIYPVCINLSCTSRCYFPDELPKCDATRIKDIICEASAARPDCPMTTFKVEGKSAVSKTALAVASTMCDGLDAPQRGDETALTVVSCSYGGTQEGNQTALAVVPPQHCTAISPSETKDLAVWSKKRYKNDWMKICIMVVTISISLINTIIMYCKYKQLLQTEGMFNEEIILIVVILEPFERDDHRRHG